ncbi:unnamed protein product [Symbiodinium necroappetens]|uniref:Uncharacterized protein n=1 Tax=Symbiodinium necroappetens TaxID=1628268 RepID=A0A813BMA9_9DINO|nr:unnamed protein product [Symbiodinium necroappetens]
MEVTAWSSATTGTRPWCPCSSTPRSPQASGRTRSPPSSATTPSSRAASCARKARGIGFGV